MQSGAVCTNQIEPGTFRSHSEARNDLAGVAILKAGRQTTVINSSPPRAGRFAGMPIGNRRYSTARPSRNGTARSVWSAAYPAALVVADEFVMHAPCELGNEKRRDTPHSKRFATSQLASGVGAGKCGVSRLVRLHKKSSRNETISRDTDRLQICATQKKTSPAVGPLLLAGCRS